MQSNSPWAVRVGIFFTLALMIVLAMSLQTGAGKLAGARYDLVARFQKTSGIEPGTRVTLRGVPVGEVKSIDWDQAKAQVRVVLEIERKYEIPKHAVAKEMTSSLLGGNFLNIDFENRPGVGQVLQRGDEIATAETKTMDEILDTVASLGTKAEDMMGNLDKNSKEALEKITSVVDENRGYLKTTSESFSRVGPKVEVLADRLNELTEGVKKGEGTVGKMFVSSDLYDELKTFTASAKDVGEQLKSGKGSLGSLIYSDDLANDAKAIFADIQKAAKQIEGAVGENREGFQKLVSSLSGSGEKISESIADFRDIAAKINRGEGTLGKLVNDPSLYNDAKKTVNQVGESFEAGEEQGVFRSFLGIVFGALI